MMSCNFKIYNQTSPSPNLPTPVKLYVFDTEVMKYIQNDENQGQMLLFPNDKCETYRHFPADRVKYIGTSDSTIQDHPFDKKFKVRRSLVYTTCGRCFYAFVVWHDTNAPNGGYSFKEIKCKFVPLSPKDDEDDIEHLLNEEYEDEEEYEEKEKEEEEEEEED